MMEKRREEQTSKRNWNWNFRPEYHHYTVPCPKVLLSTAAQWDRPPATGNKITDDFPFLVRAVRPVARPLSHPLLLLLRARLLSFFKHASSLVGAFNGDVIFIRQCPALCQTTLTSKALPFLPGPCLQHWPACNAQMAKNRD